MKIKTISRTEEDYVRKSKADITKVHRNRDPIVHPFEKAREYSRALMATKLDKIFAKPFIGALDGHKDGIYCFSSVRNNLVPFISGSCDGEIIVWDLATRKMSWQVVGHTGFVRGVTPDLTGNSFLSCGDDKVIKHWSLNASNSDEIEPINTFVSSSSIRCIDHNWVDPHFATGGEVVTIWDESHGKIIHSYKWGADSVLSVKFNPVESNLLGSTGNDRGVCLYDLRSSTAMKKVVLAMNSNKIAWNPREPLNFVVANEDFNLYTFDMRNLSKALIVHKDHVGAVMDIAFSPTGREFVSGSYDRTVRIFNCNGGRSREVYHAKRMQRVFCVDYSADAQYILSGSDDTNIRVWKANASRSVGTDSGRAERKKQYLQSLKARYSHMPEIRRIVHDKKLPKGIKKMKATLHVQSTSQRRKMENRIGNSKVGQVELVPEREKAVVKDIK